MAKKKEENSPVIEDKATKKPKPKKETKPPKTQLDFVDHQLADSGLTFDDVMCKVRKSADANNTVFEIPAFQKGTIDQYGRYNPDGDDMIIYYYDIKGEPETYRDKRNNDVAFFRVRWANPDAHTSKDGKPMKYRSPGGSGNHIYIPQKVRTMYEYSRSFTRLYLAEGEKKAEKMCKHGLLALGIPGITAIADKNKRLPQVVEQIVKRCNVKEVCFMLDSDLFDISREIEPDKDILMRPRSFYYAVKNYKEYFRTFYNIGINIQIYFGYVQPATNQKGIDDLLVKVLQGQEQKLIDEIDSLINEKDMDGTYVRLHKISTMTDQQLESIWEYIDAESFAIKHKELLLNLPYFTMWRHKWRFNEDGKFESAQPLENDEKYWDVQYRESRSGNTSTTHHFHYGRCFNFLKNRGFGRIKKISGEYAFARIDGRVVSMQEPWEIRDFIMDFTKAIKEECVLEMLYKGGTQYLGPDKLSNLDFINPDIAKSSKDRHIIYFMNKMWSISGEKITEHSFSEIESYVWDEWIKHFDAKLLTEPLVTFTKIDDVLLSNNAIPVDERKSLESYKNRYLLDFSKDGEKCHFLQFLNNASNFSWRKRDADVTPEEIFENHEHLLAKLTGFGYMLHSYKDPGVCKALVGMDGKISEVGDSNGRSGKSLLGKAIGAIVNQVYIGGKSRSLTEDNFLYNDVTDKTANIFIDDVRANLDFEHFFPLITGDLSVNVKSGGRFIIPFNISPKLYITTNHAIKGNGSSFADRQWVLSFSDYYNDTHKPTDDFGVNFFSEWNFEQWNLFYNLCAISVHLYLKHGVVESPSEDVRMRQLRQEMGEEFIMWAEEYFSENINKKLARREMYENFTCMFPNQLKFTPQTLFKKKIKAFCEYNGYTFNKNMYDDRGNPRSYDSKGMPIIDDKSGGVEYFTIANNDFNW